MIISAEGRGEEGAAQENEETPHKAKVQRRSHFISEGGKDGVLQVNMAALFSHIRPLDGAGHVTSFVTDLLCCARRPQPLCLCINSIRPGPTHLHEKERLTRRGRVNRTDQSVDVLLTAEQMDGSGRHQCAAFAPLVSTNVGAL